ncbi:MAG: tetratricopeptide repeat-containing diguanylate cyclase, partial [Dokdonella sp.]
MHRRSLSTRGLFAVALLSLCLHAQAAPATPAAAARAAATGDVAARVEAMRQTDPAAAMALGLPVWQASANKATQIDLGLALVDAAAAAGQLDDVVAIGSELRTGATLTAAQRLRLFKQLNGAIKVTRDAARIAELEADMATLETELPQEKSLAELWRQLAASYYLMGAQDDALRVAKLALSKVRERPDMVEYNANQIVFIIEAQQGRMPEAIAAFLEVERVGQALDRPADPALLHNATGVFVYAKEWDKAIEYGRRALAAQDANPRPGMSRAEILNNLASAFEGADRLDEAEATYRDALANARSEGIAPTAQLNNLAHVLRRLERPREALPLLLEAAALIEGAGDHGEAAIVHSNIGAIQVALGDRRAAAAAFERSRALFAQSDNVPRRLELYPRMIDNLDALGRHREALALMREYKTVNDASVNVESKTRIAELESAVELARKEGELADVERARADEQAAFAALQTREQRQRAIVWGLVVVLLALVALMALKIREGRARRRINEELARKNVEIETQHRELEQLTATIRRQSEEDALTGLRNRRFVKGWLDARAVAQSTALAQGQPAEPVLVALLDLDHFKRVNDLHGHEGGDHALMHFGDLLRDCARTSDVVARWGGEEFLWICPGSTMADAPALFRRLRERLQAEPLVRPGGSVTLSVSIGFALFPLWP